MARRDAGPIASAMGALGASRTRVVWGSLLGSMTLVGAILFALDRTPAPSLDGLALPALMAPGGSPSVEVVFSTRVALDERRWTSIVIHDSGSPAGTPQSLERRAKANSLRELGYHFVIGNGNGMDDGELFVGRRWRDQLPGAHTGGDHAEEYNVAGVGICLVGDLDRSPISDPQWDRLIELVAALCRRLDIRADQVHFHSELANISSPGRLFPRQKFREELAARL